MSLRFNRKIFIFCISLLLFAFNTISVFAADIVEGSLSLTEKFCVSPYILTEYISRIEKKLGYSLKDNVNSSDIEVALGEQLINEGSFYLDCSKNAQNDVVTTFRLTRDGYDSLKENILDNYYNPPDDLFYPKETEIFSSTSEEKKYYLYDSNATVYASYYNSGSRVEDSVKYEDVSYIKFEPMKYVSDSWSYKYSYQYYTVYFSDGSSSRSNFHSTSRYEAIYPTDPVVWFSSPSSTSSTLGGYPAINYDNNVKDYGVPVRVNNDDSGIYTVVCDKNVSSDSVGSVVNDNYSNASDSIQNIINNYPDSIISSGNSGNGNTNGDNNSGENSGGTLGDNANKDDSYIDDLEFPTENKPGEGSSILDWLMYWVQSVINFVLSLLKMLLKVFTSLFDFLKSLIDITSELASIWNLLFGFLPSPIPELVVLTFSCVIVISFIHFLK